MNRAAFALLALAACSSSPATPSTPLDAGGAATTGPCTPPAGIYLAHYVEQSGGTCGPRPDALVDETHPGAGCQVDQTTSTDGCRREGTVTCPTASGGSGIAVGLITSTADGKTLTSSVTITVKDASGTTLCKSTYSVTEQKQ